MSPTKQRADERSAAAPTAPPDAGGQATAADTAEAAVDATLSAGAVPHRPDVVRLVDASGNDVDLGKSYDDKGAATIVTITQRVFEEFTYPGTTTTGRRLLYHPGQQVRRSELEERTARLAARSEG